MSNKMYCTLVQDILTSSEPLASEDQGYARPNIHC